ncbi:MAG: eCIS core domain-containing protein [Chloroflexota bacterium]
MRSRLPWVGVVSFLLLASMFVTQCSSRSSAVAQVQARLFPNGLRTVAIYDTQSESWLQIAAVPGVKPQREISLVSRATQASAQARIPGSASANDMRSIRVRLAGSPADVAKLQGALDLLVTTRYAYNALAGVLSRDDVTIALTDEIGLTLPTGQTITTGGTAVTEGRRITISKSRYADKPPAGLAAMVAHELTHVAQNIAAGTAWWGWPWTTIDRETTAHLMQAITWAELRGGLTDWEQDVNLNNALDVNMLRSQIRGNPAYPDWLAPDVAC